MARKLGQAASLLQAESDAELADDVVCAWTLDDMDSNALRGAFAELRNRLLRIVTG